MQVTCVASSGGVMGPGPGPVGYVSRVRRERTEIMWSEPTSKCSHFPSRRVRLPHVLSFAAPCTHALPVRRLPPCGEAETPGTCTYALRWSHGRPICQRRAHTPGTKRRGAGTGTPRHRPLLISSRPAAAPSADRPCLIPAHTPGERLGPVPPVRDQTVAPTCPRSPEREAGQKEAPPRARAHVSRRRPAPLPPPHSLSSFLCG